MQILIQAGGATAPTNLRPRVMRRLRFALQRLHNRVMALTPAGSSSILVVRAR